MAESSVPKLRQPEFRGRIGVARGDMTPPAGMYSRAWGSSSHDIAEGVHQPLLATAVVFHDERTATELVLLAIDVMVLWDQEAKLIRTAILEHTGLQPHQLIVHPSHTHGMPLLLRKDAGRPGGHLIGPYLDSLPKLFCDLIDQARANSREATLGWNYGRCGLAFNRDAVDAASARDICGLNPAVPADDTLLVGRVTDSSGAVMVTLVNYACHPVSLGGGNKLLSPDYIGPMRKVVEQNIGGICVFFQGAAGDTTPRRSYEASVEAAEQNGRELGYAALAALNAMSPPGHELVYRGIEESGTALGIWAVSAKPAVSTRIDARVVTSLLALKDMPTRAEIEAKMAAKPNRYELERLERALARRDLVGDGERGELPLTVWQLGDAFIVATPSEPYTDFQVALRAAHPQAAIAVLMATDGARNYLPTPQTYVRDVYQVRVALYDVGALETVRDLAASTIDEMSSASK